MTGDAACKGIRDHDKDGSIGLFAEEAHDPYARPPLTKGLWKGKEESSIWRGTPELDVDIHTGRTDRLARSRREHGHRRRRRDALVRAAPARDRRDAAPLPIGARRGHLLPHARHYHRLRALAGEGVRATVIGGGFIGSEIAAALAMNELRGHDRLPGRRDRREGVPGRPLAVRERLLPLEGRRRPRRGRRSRRSAARGDAGFRVVTADGRSIDADVVVAGLGIEPRTDLAEQAGLDGRRRRARRRVRTRGRTRRRLRRGRRRALPGDRCSAALRRVEHENHANTHGRYVGANMAGADTPYDYLPFFYSDLFELGYEAVGDVDSRLDIGRRVGGAEPQGRRLLRRGRQAARVPALGRVGQGRRGARAHRAPATPVDRGRRRAPLTVRRD